MTKPLQPLKGAADLVRMTQPPSREFEKNYYQEMYPSATFFFPLQLVISKLLHLLYFTR